MGGNHSHKPAVFDENEEGKRARGAATVRRARASAWLPASITRVPGPPGAGLPPRQLLRVGAPEWVTWAKRWAGGGFGEWNPKPSLGGAGGRSGLRRRVRLLALALARGSRSPSEPEAEGGGLRARVSTMRVLLCMAAPHAARLIRPGQRRETFLG